MIRLIIADDQDLMRESLKIILQMEGDIEVVGLASNGVEAVKQVLSLKPDVVLMDIHMPEMDGVEAARLVKAEQPEVRVIMLTTFHDMEHVRNALSAGAEGYLLKAMTPGDLAAGIRLVHKGGTLIPQELAKVMISEWTGGGSAAPNGSLESLPDMEPNKPGRKMSTGLTGRELDVLREVALGLDNKAIAHKLFLSEGTVKNYISTIYSKLEVSDRVQAVLKARQSKLVDD